MVMTDKIFKINQRIEIIDNNKTYKSTIQDIIKDTILIGIPISDNGVYPLHTGEKVEYFVINRNEIFKCTSIVLGRKLDNKVNLIILSFPENIKKVQRREYFRLPIIMDIKYCVLSKGNTYSRIEDIPSGYFNKMADALTIDISGGGMKITTKEYLQKENQIVVSLNIPDEIKIIASIIWCENDITSKNYKAAIKFAAIDERTRDKIIKFIFEKSRNYIKND